MKLFTIFAIWMITLSVFAAGISIDPVPGIDAGSNPVTNLPETQLPSDAITKEIPKRYNPVL